ncbi:B- and T-lymphocyte attenuator isoform X2 [Hippopotamus amphibius kiboko]|uniref:B- and T-lymphocyte attenuator isoform X2 n=1 Tax=Hippopotamus amphibius kiboko TaxID=575201 RepID=UPI00259A225C|nr:B- and T-lymphocyte attenuator isoform X2 [Hippopotamus amphibius kiboko]
MKTLPAKLGMGIFLGILFLIPFAGIWSINGDELCDVQLYIKRYSIYVVPSGDPFELECPVKYCANRPTVTWCKLEGNSCLHLGDRLHGYMAWEERKNIPVFILHFNQVLASDSGSYRCSVNSTSGLIESHSVTINVTEWTQNNSEHPLINTRNASGPPSKEEIVDQQWILYTFFPLVVLPLLIVCSYLCCFLTRRRGEEMKLSDTTGREINLVDVPQPFRNEDTEVSTRQNSQILPSGTGIYDNDPWFRVQRKSGVYFNPCLEENKQGIVYASLNHSIIGMNPRQARNVQEAHTEYAAICVRS